MYRGQWGNLVLLEQFLDLVAHLQCCAWASDASLSPYASHPNHPSKQEREGDQ